MVKPVMNVQFTKSELGIGNAGISMCLSDRKLMTQNHVVTYHTPLVNVPARTNRQI